MIGDCVGLVVGGESVVSGEEALVGYDWRVGMEEVEV